VAGQSFVGTGTATIGPAAQAPYTTPVVGSGATPGSGGGVAGGAIVPGGASNAAPTPDQPQKQNIWSMLAGLAGAYGGGAKPAPLNLPGAYDTPIQAFSAPTAPIVDPGQQNANMQRMQLAMQMMNQGRQF
jgi:hypothetical protein